jgi:hypothetical protein
MPETECAQPRETFESRAEKFYGPILMQEAREEHARNPTRGSLVSAISRVLARRNRQDDIDMYAFLRQRLNSSVDDKDIIYG